MMQVCILYRDNWVKQRASIVEAVQPRRILYQDPVRQPRVIVDIAVKQLHLLRVVHHPLGPLGMRPVGPPDAAVALSIAGYGGLARQRRRYHGDSRSERLERLKRLALTYGLQAAVFNGGDGLG